MKRLALALLGLPMILANGPAVAATECLPADEPVALRGTINIQTTPGGPTPPLNWSDWGTHWLLYLDDPICVVFEEDGGPVVEDRVWVVDLWSVANDRRDFALEGERVSVRGIPFRASEPLHPTAVLLDRVEILWPPPGERCPFEGDRIEVTGLLEYQIMPGPPNWASIENGDKAQEILLLHPDHNVCATFGPWLGDPPEPVRLDWLPVIHVVPADGLWDAFEVAAGQRVTVTGTTELGTTGWHRSGLLLFESELTSESP